MSKSPYLENPKRIEDVIAGIQVLGSYEKKTSRRLNFWTSLLGRDEAYWKKVFEEHPEFFRVNDKTQQLEETDDDNNNDSSELWVSLRWRFAYQRTYDHLRKIELSNDELNELNNSQKKKLTRKPLTSEQIQSLISTAINLNEKAISDDIRKKWWRPLLSGVFVIFGALIGLLSSHLTNQSAEDIWLKEKRYLLLEKTIDKRIEVYEDMVKVLNSSNEAKLMWSKINVITFLDSMKIDYYQKYPLAILDSKLEFKMDENNREQINAISRLNDLTNDFAVTTSLAKTFFGVKSDSVINRLNLTPWWQNDSTSMTDVITIMSNELHEFE